MSDLLRYQNIKFLHDLNFHEFHVPWYPRWKKKTNCISVRKNKMAEMKVPVVRDASIAKSIVRMCIYAMSVIGCVLHVTMSSVEYFKYRTEPHYAPYIPSEQRMPLLSFCVENAKTPDNSVHCKSQLIDTSSVLRECSSRNFTSRKIEKTDCSSDSMISQSIDKSSHSCRTV